MSNTQTVQKFFAAYTAHKPEQMLALCQPTATFRYVPLGADGEGSLREKAAPLWQSYFDGFLDFRAAVVKIVETKEGSVVCETLMSGTQTADVANIKNKNRRLEVPHLFIFNFDDGDLISKITAFWDNDTIYRQLGHTEPHE